MASSYIERDFAVRIHNPGPVSERAVVQQFLADERFAADYSHGADLPTSEANCGEHTILSEARQEDHYGRIGSCAALQSRAVDAWRKCASHQDLGFSLQNVKGGFER
jgi:hypothetical protein